MPEKNDLADVTGRFLMVFAAAQKGPPNGNQRWMNIVHPLAILLTVKFACFFFRDLHHRNLDNEQRWFTVDFEFYVEIPCSLKHLFFQIQSFPELFAMRSYRDRSFWPWPVSHRSTSSALGQSAEKGQPSKSSANELKRRALWGRWVEVGCPLQMDLNIWRCMEHPQ